MPNEFSKNLILIPARSGSTRIHNKNIRKLGDKPLLSFVVETGIASGVGKVVVSTDSDKYAKIAKSFGAEVPFLRPKSLSRKDSASILVILHSLQWFKEHWDWCPSLIVFCPPTNPFISAETIKSMISILENQKDCDSIITITSPKTHPIKIVDLKTNNIIDNTLIKIHGKTINDFERSQDFPEVWEGSPGCRITRTRFFFDLIKKAGSKENVKYNKTYNPKSCIGYKIDNEEAIDIDTKSDWKYADFLLKNNHN